MKFEENPAKMNYNKTKKGNPLIKDKRSPRKAEKEIESRKSPRDVSRFELPAKSTGRSKEYMLKPAYLPPNKAEGGRNNSNMTEIQSAGLFTHTLHAQRMGKIQGKNQLIERTSIANHTRAACREHQESAVQSQPSKILTFGNAKNLKAKVALKQHNPNVPIHQAPPQQQVYQHPQQASLHSQQYYSSQQPFYAQQYPHQQVYPQINNQQAYQQINHQQINHQQINHQQINHQQISQQIQNHQAPYPQSYYPQQIQQAPYPNQTVNFNQAQGQQKIHQNYQSQKAEPYRIPHQLQKNLPSMMEKIEFSMAELSIHEPMQDTSFEERIARDKGQTEKKLREDKGGHNRQSSRLINSKDDDFTCHEELELKAVDKKCIVPSKNEITTSKFDFNRGKKSEKDNRQIRDFEERIQREANEKAAEASMAAQNVQQQEYSVDPRYIDRNKVNKGTKWTWWDRAILVDWMRHVATDLTFHRQTYHIAVVLLDNYLSITPNVLRQHLQIIAVSTLFISSKLEEFECLTTQQCVDAMEGACCVSDILENQIKISQALRFKLNPPTIFSLANSIMLHWDGFLKHDISMMYRENLPPLSEISFKNYEGDDFKAYANFVQLMQLIDCTVMDIQTAEYRPKALVLSVMYLHIGRQLKQFSTQTITEVFPRSSSYFTEYDSKINSLFGLFVEHCFGMMLQDLMPTIQYAATYFNLPMCNNPPQLGNEMMEKISFESYCSYQTYNELTRGCVRNRFRGIYP